jgi:hypothetical protein
MSAAPVRTAARWLALVVALAQAAGAEVDRADLAREILAFSSRYAQLGSMAALVSRDIERNGRSLAPATRALLLRAVAEHFEADALRAAATEQLAARIEADHARDALRWLQSPLGRRLTRLEAQATTLDGVAALDAYARRLQEERPPRSRLKLVDRLEAASRATDFTLDVTARTSLGISLALDATLPPAEQSGPETLRAFVEAQREPLRPSVGRSLRVAYLYRYREVSDENLAHYAAFLESESGAWYTRATQEAMLEALAGASRALGDALARDLARSHPPQDAPDPD